MAATLTHSPARIFAQLLQDLRLCAAPRSGGDWPVYYSSEPDSPDSVVTVYNTRGRDFGRAQFTGEDFTHYGLLIRVRAVNNDVGWAKANEIHEGLLTRVRLTKVIVEGRLYLVWAASKVSSPMDIGKDPRQTSKRSIFTINLTTAITPK